MNAEVLVVTPPRKAVVGNVIIHNLPPTNQGIDSVPLRLAAVIEQKHKVGFFPFGYTQHNYWEINENEVIEVLKYFHPKIVVISTDYFISNRSTSSFNSTMEISKIVKKFDKSITIICTGKHGIVAGNDYFNQKEQLIDIVITTEAELIINDLIHAIINQDYLLLESVPNILYFKDNQVKTTIKNKEQVNFDSLPCPAYHLLLPYIKDLIKLEKPLGNKITLTLRTSYGCIYNCPYCGGNENWNNYRLRSSIKVSEDIEHAERTVGEWCEFSFIDDEIFTVKYDHVKSIADIFEEKKIKIYGLLTHVKHFDSQIAFQISRFCKTVLFGGENFNDTILRKLGKNQSVVEIENASKIAHDNGLKVRIEYIVGLPGENHTTIVKNLNYVYNSLVQGKYDKVCVYTLVPHPGTKFGIHPEQNGISITDKNFDNYIEVGSYPTYKTATLTSNQISAYYMLMKYIVTQAISMRENYKIDYKDNCSRFNAELFYDYFNKLS